MNGRYIAAGILTLVFVGIGSAHSAVASGEDGLHTS